MGGKEANGVIVLNWYTILWQVEKRNGKDTSRQFISEVIIMLFIIILSSDYSILKEILYWLEEHKNYQITMDN